MLLSSFAIPHLWYRRRVDPLRRSLLFRPCSLLGSAVLLILRRDERVARPLLVTSVTSTTIIGNFPSCSTSRGHGELRRSRRQELQVQRKARCSVPYNNRRLRGRVRVRTQIPVADGGALVFVLGLWRPREGVGTGSRRGCLEKANC